MYIYNAIAIVDCVSVRQRKESDPQLVKALATILNTVGHVLLVLRTHSRTCKRYDMRVET